MSKVLGWDFAPNKIPKKIKVTINTSPNNFFIMSLIWMKAGILCPAFICTALFIRRVRLTELL